MSFHILSFALGVAAKLGLVLSVALASSCSQQWIDRSHGGASSPAQERNEGQQKVNKILLHGNLEIITYVGFPGSGAVPQMLSLSGLVGVGRCQSPNDDDQNRRGGGNSLPQSGVSISVSGYSREDCFYVPREFVIDDLRYSGVFAASEVKPGKFLRFASGNSGILVMLKAPLASMPWPGNRATLEFYISPDSGKSASALVGAMRSDSGREFER